MKLSTFNFQLLTCDLSSLYLLVEIEIRNSISELLPLPRSQLLEQQSLKFLKLSAMVGFGWRLTQMRLDAFLAQARRRQRSSDSNAENGLAPKAKVTGPDPDGCDGSSDLGSHGGPEPEPEAPPNVPPPQEAEEPLRPAAMVGPSSPTESSACDGDPVSKDGSNMDTASAQDFDFDAEKAAAAPAQECTCQRCECEICQVPFGFHPLSQPMSESLDFSNMQYAEEGEEEEMEVDSSSPGYYSIASIPTNEGPVTSPSEFTQPDTASVWIGASQASADSAGQPASPVPELNEALGTLGLDGLEVIAPERRILRGELGSRSPVQPEPLRKRRRF